MDKITNTHNISSDISQISATKKKVAIITMFHGSTNYGGVLQAYALQKIITDLGFSCEQLRYSNTSENDESPIVKIKNYIFSELIWIKNLKGLIQLTLRIVRYSINILYNISQIPFKKLYLNKKVRLRQNSFERFNTRYISASEIYTNDTISTSVNKYDIFICGSDQIWNPNAYRHVYFLSFVPDSVLKIAYAASIGIDNLSLAHITFMRPLINRLQYLSVREEQAKEQLADITNKRLEWVLDPTLLLTEDEWDTIASPEIVDTPYVFSYLLGKNKQNRKCASSFAKEKHLKQVTFPFVGSTDMMQIFFGDIPSYGGPDRFISLIRDAEYVITDSFHGTVFSLLFHKKFVVLKRTSDEHKGSMNSRLYSLCRIFNLERQIITASDPKIDEIINSINYIEIENVLQKWRSKSKSYLINALHDTESMIII